MKADEHGEDMKEGEGMPDDQFLHLEGEDLGDDDIIDLLDVIEEGRLPETTLSLSEEGVAGPVESETAFRLEALLDEHMPGPEPELKLPPDFLIEEEKERDQEGAVALPPEPALAGDAYPLGKDLEGPGEFSLEEENEPSDQADLLISEEAGLRGEELGPGLELAEGPQLKDIAEELNFAFDEMERAPDAGAPGAARDSGSEDFVIYDENSNVIGEALSEEEPGDFERELDSMLGSLELPQQEGTGLQLLEADLAALPDKAPFGEPKYGISPSKGEAAPSKDFGREALLAAAGAGLAYAGISERRGEDEREIIIGGTQPSLGLSEEQLEALITRVAEKVAERISRQTMAEVAERVITKAIAALKESLGV
jgi:hypothetical protein